MTKVVLLVTGRLAEPRVREVAKELRSLGVEAKVLVLPIAVATLATPELIEYHVRKEYGARISEVIGAIILPGGIRWSGRVLEDKLGVKVVKGTKHIDDLVYAIKELGVEGLSPDKPADELVEGLDVERVRRALEYCERVARYAYEVCGVKMPIRPPPFRVVVEVLEAWRKDVDSLVAECTKFLDEGADIVSLDLHGASPSEARSITSKVVSRLGKPVAIDASPKIAVEACRAGAEMIMNIDVEGLEKLDHIYGNTVAITVVPAILGSVPRDPRKRVEAIVKGVEKAQKLGFEKILIDPVLDPPSIGGFLDSLIAYRELSRIFPSIPMVMGVANVVELFDADSVGLNAALTALALDAGASILLTVEASPKTRGCVRELRIATYMLSVSRVLGRPPKDLGISLLVLKEKRLRESPIDVNEVDKVVEVSPSEASTWELDPLGVFRIAIDRDRKLIYALYMGRKGKVLIVGRDAMSIVRKVVELGLVSRLDHAAYLGKELGRAEEALRIDRSFVQDEPLFPDIRSSLERLKSYEEGHGEERG